MVAKGDLPTARAAPVALPGIAGIAGSYEAFIVDQFGVLHDGKAPYPGVADCLRRLREADRKVILLSNSGRRAHDEADRMSMIGIARSLYVAVMTSGENLWRKLWLRNDPFYRRLGRRCYLLSAEHDRPFVGGLGLESVDRVERADFVLVAGRETPTGSLADYEVHLETAAGLALPMLCANGDLANITSSGSAVTEGALARRYEEFGGTVRRHGKPDPSIYAACFDVLGQVDRRQTLAIGDSLNHDILGAARAGLDSILVAGGICAATAVTERRALDVVVLERLYDAAGIRPDFVMASLRW